VRIFVSGASGFLGFHLAGELARALPDAELVCQYRTEPFELEGVRWVQMRLEEPKSVAGLIGSIRPDVIFHLAAVTKVEECESSPKLAELVNVTASETIADAARRAGARLIFTSTDLVYSGRGPHVEDEDCAPRSLYARTKLAAEQAVIASGADCIVARMANAFGPALDRHRSFTKWMQRRLERGERVPLYVDQLRSFLYARDAAKGLLLLAERGESKGIYNVGGPDALSRTEFGALFFRAFGYDEGLMEPVSVEDDPRAGLRADDSSMNIERIKALGFEPMSVERALEHWRKTMETCGDGV